MELLHHYYSFQFTMSRQIFICHHICSSPSRMHLKATESLKLGQKWIIFWMGAAKGKG